MLRLTHKRLPRSLSVALIVFLLAGIAAASLIRRLQQDELQEQRGRASNLVIDHANALQRGIERALSATYALAAMLRQGNGTISNFGAVGRQLLPLYPGVSSLSLAPGGVIRSIVPLAGNERAVDLDLLTYPQTKKEAFIARDTGKLTLTGPFVLAKGKLGAIGRLPIFLDDPKGNPSFWGFINVEIGFPESLEIARLPQLAEQGYQYQLWRINPDTGEKLTIAASSSAALNEPLEHDVEVPNAIWTLSVVPTKGWGDPLGLSVKVALGLLFSLLLAFVAKLLVELRTHEQGLEALVAQRTAEVQARETDLNQAQSIAKVGSWAIATPGTEMHCSAETSRIFGVTNETLLNHEAILQHVHPDDRGAVARAWQTARKGGERFDIEYRILVGAEIRWVHEQADLQVNGEGTRERCVGTVQDVTEGKRTQEAIRASEERLRLHIEKTPLAVIEWDKDFRVVSWNLAANRIFGYTAVEAQGRHASFILPVSAKESVDQVWTGLLSGQGGERSANENITKDGRTIFCEWYNTRLTSPGGNMFGVASLVEDITERKQAEQALRTTEEQFRNLVEQSIAGTYIIQDGKFVYVNPRFAEIFGYDSIDELIGRDVSSLVAEKERSTVTENVRKRIEGKMMSISYDFTGVRKDGSMILIGVHGARATHRGRPAVIGLIQDISEKKRAEEEIQRYVEQLKTAFMSTVEVATTLSEMRDPYTAGHERRVAQIAVAIGAELGLDERRQEGLRVAGHLHDTGKIAVPSEILSKPGKLSAIELQLIQGHAQAGYDVLKAVEFPWPVAQVALQHHERVDGSGYPQGLKGDAILLESRIMAVADVVEAMSSHRPYRPGLGIEKALAEIERGRGTAYDADVADACLRLFRGEHFQLAA